MGHGKASDRNRFRFYFGIPLGDFHCGRSGFVDRVYYFVNKEIIVDFFVLLWRH